MLPIVSGLDGLVTLIPHATFPGVLVRIESTWDDPETRVVRSVEGGPWEPVRSGDPVRMLPDGGVMAGHAFDLAAIPGRQVAYTTAVADSVQTRRAASIRLPELDTCEAWLKHALAPRLSLRVRIMRDGANRSTTGWATRTDVYSARYPGIAQAGVSSIEYPLTLCVKGEPEVHRLRALIETPGPMLLQASSAHGLDEAWLAWTGADVAEDRMDSIGWEHRHITVPMVEVAAPATQGAPLVIPGPTYADLRPRAASWTHFAQEYPTSFDLLLAACGRPYGEARDGSAYTGADRVDA